MTQSSHDTFLFKDDPITVEPPIEHKDQPTWHILVVDDDEQIHEMTRLVLNSYQYQGQGLSLYHAYSKDEALSILKDTPNISVILLDVVMGTDDEGLLCAKAIREDLNNSTVRIILRTGQPGTLPEHELMLNYDINDYKSKTELTKTRLFMSITAALRTYEHLIKLDTMASQLTEFNTQLEQKVLARTTQLEQANNELRSTLDELKNTKLALEEQQQQLIHTEKLASIGQLAAGVAHEINTPLGYVTSNVESLNDYVNDIKSAWRDVEQSVPEQSKQISQKHDLSFVFDDFESLIGGINTGLKRIKVISGDLGHFSQMEKSPVPNVSINDDVITLAIHITCTEIKPSINIEFTPQPLPKIECLPIELSQVLINLLMNANDAIEQNGTIKIKAVHQNGEIVIRVSDDGCGMSEQTLNKLFDPFYTTKAVGDGTGLGLSISQKIIENHGGYISVKSQLGVGTTFTIVIPVK